MFDKYRYPDYGDQCIHRFEAAYGAAKWMREEQWVLNKALKVLHRLFPENARLFIDVGCGEGRLIPIFEAYFDQIIGLDPDSERLIQARQAVDALQIEGVSLYNAAVPDFSLNESAEFILSSHIIQHIPTTLLQPFLNWINNHLKPGALVLILFAKSTQNASYFTVVEPSGNRRIITETEFNKVFAEPNTLPAHHIPPMKVQTLLEDLGLKPIFEVSYHIGAKIPRAIIIPSLRLVNFSTYFARRIGKDHAILAKKSDFHD
jgi:SAM-dependent methyltransferase